METKNAILKETGPAAAGPTLKKVISYINQRKQGPQGNLNTNGSAKNE